MQPGGGSGSCRSGDSGLNLEGKYCLLFVAFLKATFLLCPNYFLCFSNQSIYFANFQMLFDLQSGSQL